MTAIVPTEAQEGYTFVAFLRLHGYTFTHIANETGSNGRFQGIRNKRQGTSKGFPDYFIICRNKRPITVELKRLKGSSTSPEQKAWIAALNEAGIPSEVCKGAKAAIEFVLSNEKRDI